MSPEKLLKSFVSDIDYLNWSYITLFPTQS